MRRTLINKLIELDTPDTYFLTAGVGHGVLEPLQRQMKKRFINVGIAEQGMIGIASGLALAGKKVYTYTMSCFYLRAVEQIKLDLCYQDVPVIMLGVGTGFDYEYHGSTHFALEDDKIIKNLVNIDVHTPKTKEDLTNLLSEDFTRPAYVRIGRFGENKDFDIKMDKYPSEGGSLTYYKKTYGHKE